MIKHFDSGVAWRLGSFARELTLTKYPNKAVVIDIALANGHILFRTTINSGTSLDNDVWVERKKRTVVRFGYSSFLLDRN